MKNSLLILTLESYTSKGDIPQNASKITLISNPKQVEKSTLPPSLSKKALSVFKNKKDDVIASFNESPNFLVLSTSDDSEQNRKLGISLFKALEKEEINSFYLEDLTTFMDHQKRSLLEGLLLGSYSFKKYQKEKTTNTLKLFISDKIVSKDTLYEVTNLMYGVAITRNLVNEPPSKLDSVMFAERIEKIGKDCGFHTEILHKDKIQALRMGGLLSVNKGSEIPPTFSVMTHRPQNAKNKNPLVLVGKGVTFDTGGYSLKSGDNMTSMKSDMAGAAAVVGLMAAISKNKLPYYVVGLVPSTDNKIDNNALLVDDVITMMDGTTVEVLNTDAEGRLILADALTYAKRYDPELVIDLATLTGAAAAITGPFGMAMAGNHQEKMDELKQSGENSYERVFQLPFWKEFEELLKSDVADLKNIGGRMGGASTAGKFLEHFTEYDWIHLDIAGPAFLEKPRDLYPSGATGMGVRLLYEFIKTRVEKSN